MSKKVLILSGSPWKNGNSDLLCDEFARGVVEAGHEVEKVCVAEKNIACFRGYADCVEGAKEKGVVYGVGAYAKGEIKDKPAMTEAYEMGWGV